MSNEQEIPLRQTDEAELHSDDLLAKVAASLREAGAGDPTDVPKPDESQDQDDALDYADADEDANLEADTEEADDGEGDPTSGDDEGVDQDDDTDEEKDARKGKDSPGIPDAYMRSAVGVGWTPEAVDKMVKDLGHEHVMTMLQNLHQKNNELTNTFSSLGRKAQELDQGPPRVGPSDSAPVTSHPGPNIQALKQQYGDDHELIQFYEVQQKQMNAMQQKQQETSDALVRTNTQVEQHRLSQIDETRKIVGGFFSADGLKQFGGFYGKVDGDTGAWTSLSDQQMRNRDSVCQLADEIRVGAQMHGSAMSLPEAMERAHLVVSEPISASIIRQDIMKTAEKRHKSRVVRPSDGKKPKAPVNTGRPTTRKELEARTKDRLANIFGS
ncbi:hypothetical protein LCGC14_0343290 [marine sediment metagenome]|uniref:Uncharacterized protein n=1 Tax=marine sediment metagenome TaxID=412755 RepID=A0A0F9W0F7_9ZZZZ